MTKSMLKMVNYLSLTHLYLLKTVLNRLNLCHNNNDVMKDMLKLCRLGCGTR